MMRLSHSRGWLAGLTDSTEFHGGVLIESVHRHEGTRSTIGLLRKDIAMLAEEGLI